jgi:hypothetical protein
MTAVKDNVLQIIENGLRMALLHIRATSRKEAELRKSMERVQLEIEKKIMKLLEADD